MTGRERMNAVLRKRPTDGLPWSTVVDNATLSLAPQHLRRDDGLEFYRHIGCDIFLLNGWNTPHAFHSPELQWSDEVDVRWSREGDRDTVEWVTPSGTLTGITDSGHPTKYPVDDIEAVRIYREMWDSASFVEHDDTGTLETLDTLIGDDGVVTRFWGPSTIPRLLENDMGVECFYYMMADNPDEIDELIRTIHARELDAFRMLAAGPCESVTLCENTSTYYISPALYERYNMPHQREFVDIVKQAGKVAILHMCGHVHGILDLIAETGCDGIHALTPPPTGDTPWEDALDVLGEDLIVFGCLDPSVFISGSVDEIGPALDALITPRLREANIVLILGADGIPVALERFEAVSRWMDALHA
jgi:uroporphyrinogen decarboxylase